MAYRPEDLKKLNDEKLFDIIGDKTVTKKEMELISQEFYRRLKVCKEELDKAHRTKEQGE